MALQWFVIVSSTNNVILNLKILVTYAVRIESAMRFKKETKISTFFLYISSNMRFKII